MVNHNKYIIKLHQHFIDQMFYYKFIFNFNYIKKVKNLISHYIKTFIQSFLKFFSIFDILIKP